MKNIFLLAVLAVGRPSTLLAHDGSAHVEMAWYQEFSLVAAVIGLVVIGSTLVGASYYLPRYRTVFASVGVLSVLIVFGGFQMNQLVTTPIAESVGNTLAGVPVTVYRTEGCSCCTGFAKELATTGADVTVETISPAQMRAVKSQHGIAPEQESCHTSIIDGYVVEGHVPFAAIAQLIENRPLTSGITLPGMPIGTPGMPGKQTEVYTVTTLDNKLFWQST